MKMWNHIKKLFNEKNIEWLKKEYQMISKIISNTREELTVEFFEVERQKKIKNIKYNKQLLKEIEWYLYKLTWKYNIE